MLAALATKGWIQEHLATSLKARAARLDRLLVRYDRIRAAIRDGGPTDPWASRSAGMRDAAEYARSLAGSLERGDVAEVRRLVAARLNDD